MHRRWPRCAVVGALAWAVVAGVPKPGFAQAQGQNQAQAADDRAARLAAADLYFEVVPVILITEETIAKLALLLPEKARADWVGKMRALVDKRAVAQAAREAMVLTYTAAEIRALAEFYRSPTGAAIIRKAPDYQARLMPAVVTSVRRAADRMVDAGQ